MLLFLFLLMLKDGRDVTNPAFVFLSYWLVMIAAPVILASDFRYSIHGHLSITVFVLAFTVGALVPARYNTSFYPIQNFKIWPRRNIITLSCCFACGFLIISLIREYVSNPTLVFLVFNIGDVSREFATARYSGEYGLTLIQAILMAYTYAGAIFVGYEWALTKQKPRYTILLFLIILTFSIVSNAKAVVLYSLVLMLSGFLAGAAQRRERIKMSSFFKALVNISMLFVLLIIFMVIIQNIRHNGATASATNVVEFLKVYALGHFSGYGYWFDHLRPNDHDLFPVRTTYGIVKLFYQSSIPFTFHEPKWIYNGIETNVDTMFSDLIMDVGIVGAVLFLATLGYTSSLVHRYIVEKNMYILLPILISVYSLTLWSWVNSIIGYSSIFISFIIFYLFLKIKKMRISKGKKFNGLAK